MIDRVSRNSPLDVAGHQAAHTALLTLSPFRSSGIHRPGFERVLAASCSDDVGAIFCIPRSALQGMIPSELARKARLSALTHDSITPTCSVCGPSCILFLVASVLDPDSGGGLIMRQSSYPKPESLSRSSASKILATSALRNSILSFRKDSFWGGIFQTLKLLTIQLDATRSCQYRA